MNPRTISAGFRLDISEHLDMAREDADGGRGWVWDYLGATTPISVDELREKLRLYDNATMNKNSRVSIPNHCRYFYWPTKTKPQRPARYRHPP